ncbi:MAG: ABC transporter permease subunit [Methanomassiliicoccales archaeon]|nr:MAG: ABC transporter permease subunit [Methanomassiliicoccales archaeon]
MVEEDITEEITRSGISEPIKEIPGQEDVMQPKRYPIKSYLGPLSIAKREFTANMKSVRMVVLMLLFVLAVLGGAYGISGLSTSTTSLPEVEVLAWAVLEDDDGMGYPDDLLVLITDGSGTPRPNVKVEYVDYEEDEDDVFFEGNSNSNGAVVVNNITYAMLGTYSIRVTYEGEEIDRARTSYALELSPKPAYVLAHVLDLDDDNVEDDVLVMVTDGDGIPIADVEVSLSASNYHNNGTTDAKGTVTFRNLMAGEGDPFMGFSPKKYDVEITHSGSISTNTLYIYQDDESMTSLFEFEGPDEIIYFVASVFIMMLGPIIAISLSFDSITKEKLQRSMDFLLSRPMGRRGIIVGKFLGILSAIALPVTAINLLAVVVISSVTNKSPTGSLVAGFLVYTVVFIAIYILLQQIFSTLAKTTGTAILSGIAIWLIFNMFWSLISIAAGAAMGYQLGSDAWIKMNNQIGLMNPSGSYQLALAYLLPVEGEVSILGVPGWLPPVVMAVWLVVMFLLATEIFVRKADS